MVWQCGVGDGVVVWQRVVVMVQWCGSVCRWCSGVAVCVGGIVVSVGGVTPEPTWECVMGPQGIVGPSRPTQPHVCCHSCLVLLLPCWLLLLLLLLTTPLTFHLA